MKDGDAFLASGSEALPRGQECFSKEPLMPLPDEGQVGRYLWDTALHTDRDPLWLLSHADTPA